MLTEFSEPLFMKNTFFLNVQSCKTFMPTFKIVIEGTTTEKQKYL